MLAAESLAADAEAWCAGEAKREDARLRREAVLNALSQLGYEAREGMAVAWAEGGRIVLRKPSDTNYGVELMSPGDAAALQAQVVAFDYPARGEGSRLRDKEVEESWCSEAAVVEDVVVGFEDAVREPVVAARACPSVRCRQRTLPSGICKSPCVRSVLMSGRVASKPRLVSTDRSSVRIPVQGSRCRSECGSPT